MMGEAAARAVLAAAFAAEGIGSPVLAELQAVGAVGRFEGMYGSAFGGANNWGAIQVGHGPPCGDDSVEVQDSHADGTKYQWCYRRYDSPEAGARDLLRTLYKRAGVPEAARAGDSTAMAAAMRASHYFEAPADRYGQAIARHAAAIAQGLSEPLMVGPGGVTGGGGTDGGGEGIGLAIAGLGLGTVLLLKKGARR
jgi:hypothetical protein